MTWIKTISYEKAEGKVKDLYERIKGPNNNVDNIMMAHSLRPHSMEGHMALYKAALHDPANTLPTWFQEIISSYVSILNDCDYSLANHWANACHLKGDSVWSTKVKIALENHNPEAEFDACISSIAFKSNNAACRKKSI